MKLLVTGTRGYIGGSVAHRLAEAGHEIVPLLRDGTPNMESYDSLKKLLATVDGVVNTADADNIYFVTTALEALEGTGKTFLHTSGSSIVGDKSGGERSEKVHHEDDYVPRPEKAPRVAIDRLVTDSAKRGVRGIVICPTMIYGEGLGPKKTSIQVPLLTALAKEKGGARHIGRGENVWSTVHVADLADLYVLAVAKAKAGDFFFAENGESSLKDVTRKIQKSLGLPGEPQSMTIDEAIAIWGPDGAHYGLGSNSRVTAARAREVLGWKPKHRELFV